MRILTHIIVKQKIQPREKWLIKQKLTKYEMLVNSSITPPEKPPPEKPERKPEPEETGEATV